MTQEMPKKVDPCPQVDFPIDFKDVTIKLPVKAWNIVLKGLGELPLKESGEIVHLIKAQAFPQINSSELPSTEE